MPSRQPRLGGPQDRLEELGMDNRAVHRRSGLWHYYLVSNSGNGINREHTTGKCRPDTRGRTLVSLGALDFGERVLGWFSKQNRVQGEPRSGCEQNLSPAGICPLPLDVIMQRYYIVYDVHAVVP